MAQEIPSRIGQYQITRPLGKGVMGQVYMGTGGGNVFHAVKTVDPKVAERQGHAQLFVNEIVHDNILQWVAIEQESGQDYFVSDYLEVRPATRRTLRTTLSDEILELYATCADALAMVHERDILHGNLKTSNILIRRAGPRKVMPIISDFGLGYRFEPLTWTPEMIKSAFAYMSPEKIQDVADAENPSGKTGPASDVYSLTCCLVESLAGREVYREGATPQEILDRKQKQQFRLLNINYPCKHVEIGPLNELVRQNLAVDPGARVQTMKEFAERLRTCKAEKKEEFAEVS